MVQILGQNIQPLSCQIIYLNYLAIQFSIWKPNITSFWFDTPLPENLTFWGGVGNLFISLMLLKYVYDSAYLNVTRDKRIFYAGFMGAGVVCLLIAGWTAWTGSPLGQPDLKTKAGDNSTLFWSAVALIADMLVLGAVVEVEERMKERKAIEALDEKRGKSYTF